MTLAYRTPDTGSAKVAAALSGSEFTLPLLRHGYFGGFYCRRQSAGKSRDSGGGRELLEPPGVERGACGGCSRIGSVASAAS
jgi:hypothetical protein